MPVHTDRERAKKGITRGTGGRLRKAVRRKAAKIVKRPKRASPGAAAKAGVRAAFKRSPKRKGR